MDRRTNGHPRFEQALAMHVSWSPSFSASALHAAEALARFHWSVTDPRVSEVLTPYAVPLGEWIESGPVLDASRFWSQLIACASAIDSNHELAESVWRRQAGAEIDPRNITQLAGYITDIEAAYKGLFPKFAEQILLRARPLQEQWLGYGNGLMAHVGRLTEKGLIPETARVVLIQPVLGGYGFAHIEQNIARIEAVLTNPMVELPEVVRLAWLVSQLQLDLPSYSEPPTSSRNASAISWMRLAPLAMLPAALAAAEVMELSRCDEAVAALAIEHWHIAIPQREEASGIASLLMDWWETYLQTRPLWSTAMQALSKMLSH